MKTIMSMKWDGVTPDQYEQVRKAVNWEGDRPKGSNFHIAGFHNGHLHVTDIWDSEEDFSNFVQTRLMPGVAKVGIQGQPDVHMYPLHTIYMPAPAELTA